MENSTDKSTNDNSETSKLGEVLDRTLVEKALGKTLEILHTNLGVAKKEKVAAEYDKSQFYGGQMVAHESDIFALEALIARLGLDIDKMGGSIRSRISRKEK